MNIISKEKCFEEENEQSFNEIEILFLKLNSSTNHLNLYIEEANQFINRR
jgi:hypothetical protein